MRCTAHLSFPCYFCIFICQMDPVQKAVINHTFGVPLVKTKRPVISCNVCQIRFNSEVQEHESKTIIRRITPICLTLFQWI